MQSGRRSRRHPVRLLCGDGIRISPHRETALCAVRQAVRLPGGFDRDCGRADALTLSASGESAVRPACPDGFAATSESGRSMAQRSPDRRGSEKSAGFPGVLRTMSVRSFGPRGSAGRLPPQEEQRQKPQKTKELQRTEHAPDAGYCAAGASCEGFCADGACGRHERLSGSLPHRTPPGVTRGIAARGRGKPRKPHPGRGFARSMPRGEAVSVGLLRRASGRTRGRAPSVWRLRESPGRGAPSARDTANSGETL